MASSDALIVTEPILIFKLAHRYMLYDANTVAYLRREHNICGVLVGTLAQASQQNVFLGLPLELMPEEARLLVEKKVAHIVDDASEHKRKFLGAELNADERRAYTSAVRKQGQSAATEATKKSEERKKAALTKLSTENWNDIPEDMLKPTPRRGKKAVLPKEEVPIASNEVLDDEVLFGSPANSFPAKPVRSRTSSDSSRKGPEPYAVNLTTSHPPLPVRMVETSSSSTPPAVSQSYPLYKHLHENGYFITPGLRFGCQYTAYPGDPLRFHSHFLCNGMDWDHEFDLLDLVGGGRLGTGVKKGFLVGGEERKEDAGQETGKVRAFCIEWGGSFDTSHNLVQYGASYSHKPPAASALLSPQQNHETSLPLQPCNKHFFSIILGHDIFQLASKLLDLPVPTCAPERISDLLATSAAILTAWFCTNRSSLHLVPLTASSCFNAKLFSEIMTARGIYEPLERERKEIRVLVLEHGLRSSPDLLVGNLVRTSLAPPTHEILDGLEYETISYCWGDSSLRSRICLNGQTVEVPRSSEMALRRMRLPDRPRRLFTDAVCINQDDLEERAQQVAMMGEVFSNGKRNLIYLGKDDENIEAALESVQLLLDTEIAEAIDGERSIREQRVAANGIAKFSSTPFTVPINEDALICLYSKPWFSRLWVVQESALSIDNLCHCGDLELNILDVLLVALWLNFKTPHVREHRLANLGDDLSRILDFSQTQHSLALDKRFQTSVNNVFELGQHFDTTDLKDKIFAVLTLFDWSNIGGLPHDLQPNYTRDLPDLLSVAIMHCMKDQLEPLRLVGDFRHRSNEDIHIDDLLSWVFRMHRAEDVYGTPPCLARDFDASKGIPKKLEFHMAIPGSKDFSRLEVKGFGLDEVSHVLLSSGRWDNFWQTYAELIGWSTEMKAPEYDDLVCTLLAGYWVDDNRVDEGRINTVKLFLRKLALEAGLSPPLADFFLDTDKMTGNVAECRSAIYEACGHRSICKTPRNLLVLAPEITLQGDIIVQLFGNHVPCILRPCRNGEYEYIGQAYVHGRMFGESVDEWQAAGGIEETFMLI